MNPFKFVTNWRDKLIKESVDRKMQAAAKIGEQVLMQRIHVVTGYLKSTSNVMYRQSDQTILENFDAPYALNEFARGGAHDAVNPSLQAMAAVFGGRFEVHFPHATVSKKEGGLARLRQNEVWLHSSLGGGRGGLAGRTRIHSRRWYKRMGLVPGDPMTPLV